MKTIKKIQQEVKKTLLRKDALNAMMLNGNTTDTVVVNQQYKALDGDEYQRFRQQSYFTTHNNALYITTEVRCTCDCDEVIDYSNVRVPTKLAEGVELGPVVLH